MRIFLLLPPLGEGWDGGQRAQFHHAVVNRLNHRLRFQKRQVRRKPHHIKTCISEKVGTPCVISQLIRMLRSVQLNDQSRSKARKISHIRTQRMLTSELEPQLLTAQPLPQQAFAIGHLLAKRLGECSGVAAGLVLHVVEPPSRPSPSGGRRNTSQLRTGLPVLIMPMMRSCVFGCSSSAQNALRSSVIKYSSLTSVPASTSPPQTTPAIRLAM